MDFFDFSLSNNDEINMKPILVDNYWSTLNSAFNSI